MADFLAPIRRRFGRTAAEAIITTAATPPAQRANPQAVLPDGADVGAAWARPIQYAKGISPAQARQFSIDNEWARAATTFLRAKVARGEWDILPIDPNKRYSTKLQARIKALLLRPTPFHDSFRSWADQWLEDVIVCGKGGFEHVRNFRGMPLALIPYDTAYMSVNPDWDGTSATQPRYIWAPPRGKKIFLLNEDITLVLQNQTTYRPEGLAAFETLKKSIEADAAGSDYIQSLLDKYPPPGWIHLGETSTPKQVNEVKTTLNNEVLGRGGLLVTGNMKAPAFMSLHGGSSKDNELMAWTIYFAQKMAAVFGISPQDLGLTMDVNRATGQQQAEITREDGVKNLFILAEEYINAEVVSEFGDPAEINLAFRYLQLTARDRGEQVDIAQRMIGDVPLATINEGRAEADMEPVELGDCIVVVTKDGPVAVAGPDADAFNKAHAPEPAPEPGVAPGEQEPGTTPATPANGAHKGGEGNSDDASRAAIDVATRDLVLRHLHAYLSMRALVHDQPSVYEQRLDAPAVRRALLHAIDQAAAACEGDTPDACWTRHVMRDGLTALLRPGHAAAMPAYQLIHAVESRLT